MAETKEIKELKEVKEKIISNLQVVFYSKELRSHLKEESFRLILIKQLNILFSIETKIKSKDLKSEEFIKEYNKITNRSDSLKEVSLDNIFDIKDEVNYLNVYVVNIYKNDLSSFKKDYSENSETIDTITNNNEINNSTKHQSSTNNTNQNNSSSNFSGQQNYNSQNANPQFASPEQVQEQVYLQMARSRLEFDIRNDSFYKYTSKPKILLIMKRIFFIALIISGISFLAPMVTLFMSIGVILPVGDGKTDTLEWNGTLFYAFQSLFAFAIMFGFGFMNLFKKQGDNQKYHFSFIYVFFIGFLFLFYGVNTITLIINTFQRIDTILSLNVNNMTAALSYQGFLYSNAIAYFSIPIILVIAIVTFFFNPKIDVERVNAKLNQYIEEIKRQQKTPN